MNCTAEYLETILDLDKRTVGVRFLEYQKDYDALSNLAEKKGSICFLVRQGMEGNHIRANKDTVTCHYGAYALGIRKPDASIVAGQSYYACGLYKDKSIARKIVDEISYINQEIYGIEIGPVSEVESPDIVIIACNAKQAMRIVQGYAYEMGAPKNINFFGNQAMCGDLISKPYMNSDLNLSLFCKGARASGRFEDGEVGLSMPYHQFDKVVDGLISTVIPVATKKEKREIMERLEEKGLKFPYEMNYEYVYGIGLSRYDNMVEQMHKEE